MSDNRNQLERSRHRQEKLHRLVRQYQKEKRRKRLFRRVLVAAIILMLFVSVLIPFGMVRHYQSMTQQVEFREDEVQNTDISTTELEAMKGYWSCVLFGVDSRDGTVGKGNNADVQIIISADLDTGDIRLVSIYRDTYLNLGKEYAKINKAYTSGGPEQAVKALNRNLDLNIDNYATFNWKAVADAIDMLGGVDINVTDQEFYYMNAYITETCQKSGISAENPAAEYLDKAGYQHLNGVQAVAYARLRYTDDDFERTKRQRAIMMQLLDKAKGTSLLKLNQIVEKVLPETATNIGLEDALRVLKNINKFRVSGNAGFPSRFVTKKIGSNGDCVIPADLEKNVQLLHEFLFDVSDYDVSGTVSELNQKIRSRTGITTKSSEIIRR